MVQSTILYKPFYQSKFVEVCLCLSLSFSTISTWFVFGLPVGLFAPGYHIGSFIQFSVVDVSGTFHMYEFSQNPSLKGVTVFSKLGTSRE